MSDSSLVFETIFTDGIAHLSYLIGDKSSGSAAVIDPRRDVDIYIELAREKKVTITHAVETHIHADLVSGVRELAERTGTARPHLSAEGGARYGFPFEKLRDGDEINLGRVILTARHTPGHTPEHLSFLVAEDKRPNDPFAVFSGDTLFADSVGRPDLLGAGKANDLAKDLFKSLREFYLRLPDYVRIHPGHGAGSPCGADIGDRLVSTIGYERRHNEALKIEQETAFVDHVLRTAPPEPTYYKRMKKLNADGPDVLGGLPVCKSLSAGDFKTAIEKREAQLVDNRDMFSFGGGHIAGALNIGPRPMLSIWAGWLLDPEKPIFLVLPNENALDELQRQLIRVGFDSFGGFLRGGMEAWADGGHEFVTIHQMSVHELNGRNRAGLQILDVRAPEEWEAGHVPGAHYVFLPELKDKCSRLRKDLPVAVYCDSGYRASIGASQLQASGFSHVSNVPGSWKAWKAQKYPVEYPKEDKKASDTNRQPGPAALEEALTP